MARLVAVPQVVEAAATGKDPFYPPMVDLVDLVERSVPGADSVSAAERLEMVAAKINPTGSISLGGEPYLLFTEKRLKKGDKVTVAIDAVEYEVEIISIEKSRFRIRYHDLETTRSIK